MYSPDAAVEIRFESCIECFVLGTETVIGQPEVFIAEGIDIGKFFFPGTAAAVLEHSFNDGIGPFAMVDDLFLIFSHFIGKGPGLLCISFFQFFLLFLYQFAVYFRKVVDEIEGILDLVGNTGREFRGQYRP